MIEYDKLIGIRTLPPRSFCKDRHYIWHNSALNLKKNFLMVLSFNVNYITIWCFLCDLTRYLVMVFFSAIVATFIPVKSQIKRLIVHILIISFTMSQIHYIMVVLVSSKHNIEESLKCQSSCWPTKVNVIFVFRFQTNSCDLSSLRHILI